MMESPYSLLILQHPQEQKSPLNTAVIVEKRLSQSRVRAGLSWPNLTRAWSLKGEVLKEPLKSSEWGVLYLGTKKTTDQLKDALKVFPKPALVALSKKGLPLAPDLQKSARTEIKGLIFLDGTWAQSKTMWWRNAWLTKLRRFILVPESKSLYGNLRKEPRAESVSTLESVGLTLSLLTGKPEFSEGLNNELKSFLKHYPRSGV